ncbi:hypothetical protein [Rhizobacter sp. P5_C2]
MSAYSLLLEIEVRHGYYADEACPSLRFVPTPACQRLVARVGGLSRTTPHGLALWAERDRLADLPSEDTADDTALAWTLHLADNAFCECTEVRGRPQREVLLFDAANAVADASTGLERLHSHEAASNEDLCPLAEIDHDGRLALAAPHGNPCGLVRIPPARLRTGKRFLIRFAPRATVWTYCLVGDWREPGLHIVDLAQQVSFTPLPPRQLADGRPALAFRASSPIALHQQPPERFQLRSRAPDNASAANAARTRPDKVIVKRLPAAAPHHFSREEIGGAQTWVSEIFVHR